MSVSRRARLIRVATIAVTGVAVLGHAGPATAGEFPINACQADRVGSKTTAFEDFATRGMMWKRACDFQRSGLRGLVTANVARAGRVARGAVSRFVLRAPPGTSFSRFTWAGEARRRDCRYALQLWADAPGRTPTPMKNVKANTRCPTAGRAQAATWRERHTYNVSGTTRIVQRTVCVGAPGQNYCSSRGLNYIRTSLAQAIVVDTSLPGAAIIQDNPFTQGQWVGGAQRVNYAALDNVGVKYARPVFNGVPDLGHTRPCDYAQRVPCPNGNGTIDVNTRQLREGSQSLVVEALDTAGNPGPSAATTVRIDNSPPGAVPTLVEGGEGWRNPNDFDIGWVNPPEADRAPVVAAHYRLCRIDGSDCSQGSQTGNDISRLSDLAVRGPGEWQLRMWRDDAAANQDPANASEPVTLRFDPEPPTLGFEPVSAADPTLITVAVEDKVSGVVAGGIELSRPGSGSWQSLPTALQGGRLVARIDDAALPPGQYVLRATARDQASNQSTSDRLLNGQPMAITLPLRSATTMRAGVFSERVVRKTIRRRGKRRIVRRRVVELEARARAEFGRQVKLGGTLTTTDGRPIPGAQLQVFSRGETEPERLVGVVTTDAQGAYAYNAVADATRTFRLAYAGSAVTLPTQGEVALLTSAASTIRATPRRLRNGQSVRFSGRLRSLPAPPAGKLIELQVVLSGRWQTFRTTRTDAAGNWSVRYHFRRSCGLLRYRFRLHMPEEAGYPFESNRTRSVAVRVRGAPCR